MSRRTRGRNAFETTLNGGITDSATTIAVVSTTGLDDPAYLVIDPDDNAKREIIKVASISGTNLQSVTRGLDGSSAGAQAHDSGAVVRSVPVHQVLDDIFSDIEDLETTEADFITHEAAQNPHGTTASDVGADVVGSSAAVASDLSDHAADPNAHAAELGAIIPTGMLAPFGGAAAPTGWLLCDGSAVSRTTYADLFTAIGVTYGAGNGSTTFNVPDARGRAIYGKAVSGTGSALGEQFGSMSHTHTQPTHTHSQPTHTHTGPSHTHTGPSHTHDVSGTSGAGGSHSHSVGGTTGSTTGTAIGQEGTGSSFEYVIKSHTHSFADTSSAAGSHSHSFSDTSSAGGTGATGAAGTGNTGAGGGDTTGAGGGDATGGGNPPGLVANWIIKT